MLRMVIQKRNAVLCGLLVLLCLALATIWPMRLYRENHAFASGLDPVMISDSVTEDTDAGEYFTAQYDHLQTLKFYVHSVQEGGKAQFQLFRVLENGAMELTAEEEVKLPDEVPAYAAVSVDADLIPGETYVYTIRGMENSRFTVGFESQEEALSTGKSPLYQTGFYHDSGIDGVALKTSLDYRIAETKGPSAVRALFYLAAAALLALCVSLFFRKFPEKNTVTSVLRAMQAFLTPAVVLGFGAAFLAVWPLKLFDGRVPDILIYEAGILLGAGWCLYGLWHKRDGIPDLVGGDLGRKNLWHYGIILCIALIMNYSADYMNATNDYIHDTSMARIVVLLCLITLLMGDIASNCNAGTAAVTAVSVLLAAVYSIHNRIPAAADPEAAWKNSVTVSKAAACAAAAIAVTSLVCMLADRIRRKEKPLSGVSRFLTGVVLLFAVWLLIFRNTRLWIPLLVGIWLLFYVRYRYWTGRERLLQDLCEGILLDFAFKVAYTMLHRYYLAYMYSRFSMHFHTPTVTAYYLVIVCAAAITLFVRKYRVTAGQELRARAAGTWKEAFFLGLSCSYMAMSLTRSGIGVLALLLFIAAFYLGNFGPGKKRIAFRLKTGVQTLLAFLLIVAVTFPVAFTGQRVISTVYAHPHRFEELEPYDDWVLRNVTWNCTAFMNVEIFIRDFGDRILGGEIGSKIYYGNEWYVPQGYRTADVRESREPLEDGRLVMADDSGSGLAALGKKLGQPAAPMLLATQAELEAGSIDTGDLSNGRMGLYLAYLKQLNWTGHDEMGVVLESGELAVHAHNIFLQAAYDCGIPAGALLLLTVLSVFAASFVYARKKGGVDPYALLPFLLVTGFGLTGMVEWIFHFSNPYTIVMLFAMAPLLFPEKDAERTES